jgi:hypothetical protein
MGRNEKKKSVKLNKKFIIPGDMAIVQDTRVRCRPDCAMLVVITVKKRKRPRTGRQACVYQNKCVNCTVFMVITIYKTLNF